MRIMSAAAASLTRRRSQRLISNNNRNGNNHNHNRNHNNAASTPLPAGSPHTPSTPVCDPRPKKRKRSNTDAPSAPPSAVMETDEPELFAAAIPADTTESVKKDVGPFLSKHIPQQYAPQGSKEQQETHNHDGERGNTRYCYRHRPDVKCRRPADEPTMEQLQSVSPSLPPASAYQFVGRWVICLCHCCRVWTASTMPIDKRSLTCGPYFPPHQRRCAR
jgi:hypothetical protein